MPLPTRGKPHLNRQEEMSWSSFRRRRAPGDPTTRTRCTDDDGSNYDARTKKPTHAQTAPPDRLGEESPNNAPSPTSLIHSTIPAARFFLSSYVSSTARQQGPQPLPPRQRRSKAHSVVMGLIIWMTSGRAPIEFSCKELRVNGKQTDLSFPVLKKVGVTI